MFSVFVDMKMAEFDPFEARTIEVFSFYSYSCLPYTIEPVDLGGFVKRKH